jgi:hypothetical protein
MATPRTTKADAKMLAVVKAELWKTVDFYRHRLAAGDCNSDYSAHAMGLQTSGWAYGVMMLARKLIRWPAIKEAETAYEVAEAVLKRDREIASAWLRAGQ